MKIVFMGTPDYAASALEALIRAGHEICAAVTQPDKPKGRSKELQMSPVKECALTYDIPVFQPVKVKLPESCEQLRDYGADVFVVAAFGQILSQEILDIPRFGCINIHGSLLPAYRGAAPIQSAIIEGEKETGITIMQMDAGIDTGAILFKQSIAIADDDTYGSLYDKLAVLGADMIVPAIEAVEKGEVLPVPQSEEGSSYAGMIRKSMGIIDFTQSARQIDRLIRGLNPWPSAYTFYKGKTLKIWEAFPEDTQSAETPGTIVNVESHSVTVSTGNGLLQITQLQLEGKKRMTVKDFLLGSRIEKGEKLGC